VISVEVSPTARALQTLELLQRMPGVGADQLGERLGVTGRAARRYIAILREAGIPVESIRGRYGGYRIGRGLRPPPLVFTSAEALGLVMAVLDGQHAAADADEPVGAALGKLIQALPESVSRPASVMRDHALAVPGNSAIRADPAITSDLVAAVAARRRIRLSYRSAAGSPFDTDVDPWAVLVRYGRWYLLCFAHHADAIRTLRIDRIRAVVLLEQSFEPPEDLDPVAALEHHLGTGWPFEVRVVFDASFAEVNPFIPPPMGRLEPLANGTSCLLTGSTNNPPAYAGERLSAIPYAFHVEGGPELREAVEALARRLTSATA
jgi:predicted DNA-binding transcriptional regulator YafY